jgi:putative ABC transport system permease protein
VRREIFGGTVGQTGLGEQLRIKQFSCEVIGILAAKGQGGMGDQDDTVVVPLHTLQRRVTGSRKVNTLSVSMEDGSDSARLKASLRQLLRERRKLADGDDDNFNIFDTQQLAETLSSTMGVLTSAAGRGGRGQPAGGRHRHHEHHAGQRDRAHARDRPAPGGGRARRRGAAAVPDRGGGAVGAGRRDRHRHRHRRVLGRVARDGRALCLRPGINLLSLVFSAAIGVVFGYFPARRAAQMDPIEACGTSRAPPSHARLRMLPRPMQ